MKTSMNKNDFSWRSKIVFLLLIAGALTLKAQYPDEISNEFFQKHKGQIVFSKTDPGNEGTAISKLSNEFTLSDNLFAEAVFKEPLAKTFAERDYMYDFSSSRYTYNYALELNVDGEKKGRWLFELPENYFKHAVSLNHIILTDQPDLKRLRGDFVNDWVNILSGLSNGTHELTLTVRPYTVDLAGSEPPAIATGSFELKVDDAGKMALADKDTDIPPATMINKRIEASILSASDEIYPYARPLRAFITDKNGDWKYTIDDNGNITSRYITASVAYKTETTGKCWIKSAIYRQPHEGYGEFGSLVFEKEIDGYYEYQVPCDKLFKKSE